MLCVDFFFLSVFFRYKFDDERVTKEDTKKALEEQYGGEEEVSFFLSTVHPVYDLLVLGISLIFYV